MTTDAPRGHSLPAGQEISFAELLERARALANSGGRRLLGICGAPGAGKSTLAERIVDGVGESAALVGMDGFHYAQRELDRLRRTDRKGASDTFDADGYVALLTRLRAGGPDSGSGTIYAPEFRRDLEEPIAAAVPVFTETTLIVTEGNYLLVDRPPWAPVRALLDEVWFVAPPDEVRLRRLVERHRRFGRTVEQARMRSYGPDQRNAELILPTAVRADLVISRIIDPV